MKTLVISLLLAAASLGANAGLPKVLLYGNVIEGDVKDLLTSAEKRDNVYVTDVVVTIECEGEVIQQYTNRKTGFYSVILESGRKYMVTFSRDGFITKRFEIDTEKVGASDKKKSFKMYTDVTLFSRPESGDYSTYDKQPVAKCRYDSSKERMDWDMEYARMAFEHFRKAVRTNESTASLTE